VIVLASASAARAAMLTAAGVSFAAHPAHVDEVALRHSLTGQPAARVADALAEVKALKLSPRFPGQLVLGADQLLVTAAGALLDKPVDRAAAAEQLRALSGSEHRLVSAAVIAENGRPVWRSQDSARLTMRTLSDAFIEAYLDAELPGVLGCVGSYRIEGRGAQLFARVDGDHFTVQGLPLLAVLDYLRVRGELLA